MQSLEEFIAKKAVSNYGDIKGLYSAFTVCGYLVNHSNHINATIDSERINLLLYFVQAKFLFDSNCAYACFDEDISLLGSLSFELLHIDVKEEKRSEYVDDESILMIESVVERYSCKSNQELNNIIVKSSVYNRPKNSKYSRNVIKKNKIFDWMNEVEREGEIPSRYSVTEIGAFVVNQSNLIGVSIDIKRLQKILFLIQVFYLRYYDGKAACFSEDFAAWGVGPVCLKSYEEYISNAFLSIEKLEFFPPKKVTTKDDGRRFSKFRIERDVYDDGLIDDVDKAVIIDIIERTATKSTSKLIDVSCDYNSWKIARARNKCNELISKESIYEDCVTRQKN